MNIKEFKIETESYTHDCDDCGFYVDDEVIITFPCGNKLTLLSDGHFGAGDWSGQFKDAYLIILNYLSINVSFDGYVENFYISDEKFSEYSSFKPKVERFDNVDFTIEDTEIGVDSWIFNGRIDSEKLGNFEFMYKDGDENIEFDATYESLLYIYLSKICTIKF